MHNDLPTALRASAARATVVLVVALAGGLSSCDDDADRTPASDPSGSLVGSSSAPGSGSTLTGSTVPPQATAAPNPDAGGDGAPTPTDAP